MLDKKVDEIVYEDGKVVGVRSGDEIAKCSQVICDPSYAPEKVQKVDRVIRAICLLRGPIPNTENADSFQLIIPQNQVKRKNDIYVAGVSSSHNVCEKNHYLAIVSTIIETDNPQVEIQPGLDLLGPIVDKYVLFHLFSFLRIFSVRDLLLTSYAIDAFFSIGSFRLLISPSPSRTVPRTRSSSPSHTMPPLTLRLSAMMSRISTSVSLATLWS